MPSDLPAKFSGGRPLFGELTAGRLNAILDEIRRNKPIPGKGMTSRATGTGLVLDVTVKGASPSAGAAFPFEVITRQDGGTTYGGVVYNSSLFASLVPDDRFTITGLLTNAAPANDDTGWFTLTDLDKIWLEVTFGTDGNPTAATIENGSTFDVSAAAWAADSILEDDAGTLPIQTTARKLIASYEDGIITQATERHQVLLDCIVSGASARYPFDHSGSYVAP